MKKLFFRKIFMHSHALRVAALALGAATVMLPLAAAPAAADDLTQIVDQSEQVVRGKAVSISAGHIDMGPKLVAGKWELLIRDDTVSPAVWRQPQDVVIRVADSAKMAAPSGEKYAFLPSQAGQDVYVVPQVQAPHVVWIGWNTQDPAIAQSLDRGANLRLLGLKGAGELALFLQDGAFGNPLPMWDSRKSEPQDVWMEANTHVHANWVFTKPGAYTAAIQVIGKDKSQQEHSASATLRFAVGSGVSDAAVRAAPEPHVAASADGAASSAGEAQAPSAGVQNSDSTSFVASPIALAGIIAGGVGVIVLIAALIWASRRSRRLRREALAGVQGSNNVNFSEQSEATKSPAMESAAEEGK
ncbi:MAG: choice-of-anchor M domain-containing protein [Arcanobacterium sp.]|nr:choice-of-anchor M domain-containing protein [Arcanobacterium sp.]MDY5588985.1 choice-of-anchor M domain-containing protein [Arcanobacterium sp.]